MANTSVGSKAAYATVSIGASAAIIKAGRTSRKSIIVQNVHATNVLYLGNNSSVTTSNGLKLAAGESVAFDGYNGDVYGIASGASTDVRYFEVYGA